MYCVVCALARYAHVMFFFFFNDTATTEIYTLSLHDALPISSMSRPYGPLRIASLRPCRKSDARLWTVVERPRDRKSTRLNSSHANISYAVFCLKKKKEKNVSGTMYALTEQISS